MDDKLYYTFTDGINTLNGRYYSCLFNKNEAVQPTPKRESNLHSQAGAIKMIVLHERMKLTEIETVRLEGTAELLAF